MPDPIQCPYCDTVFVDGQTTRNTPIPPRSPLWGAKPRFWIHCITKHTDSITVRLSTPNDVEWYIDE